METIFRDYTQSEGLRSDRSAGDRQRHRQKVRQAIRDNIADLVAEEAIIGQSGNKTVKVPIRGIREYRFVYGQNSGGVGQGNGDTQEGQVVGRSGEGEQGNKGAGPAGDNPGSDYYETEITLDELIEIMFEDLELPDLERRRMREVLVERTARRKGYRKKGIRAHLSKRRTARARIKRKVASAPYDAEAGARSEARARCGRGRGRSGASRSTPMICAITASSPKCSRSRTRWCCASWTPPVPWTR